MKLIIEQLKINGFGKLRDRFINLSPGFNIIFGKNESGKSTLHQFVGAVFYGFIKPNLKSTRFFNELEQYKPMEGSEYRGYIIFNCDGKTYRLVRDFSNRNYLLFNDLTNENLTLKLSSIIQGQDAPGNYFFNMDYNSFRNLIFIEQNHRKMLSEDWKGVQHQIRTINLMNGEGISLEKAISYIQEKQKEIGSKNNPMKKYGYLENKKKNLLLQKVNLENNISNQSNFFIEKLSLEDEINKISEQLSATNIKLEKLRESQRNLLVQEKNRLESQMKLKMDTSNRIRQYSLDVKDEIILSDAKEHILRLEEKGFVINQRLTQLNTMIKNNGNNFSTKELLMDFQKFNMFRQKKEEQILLKKSIKKLDILFITLFFICNILFVFYFFSQHKIFIIPVIVLNILFLFFALYIIFRKKRCKALFDEAFYKEEKELLEKYEINFTQGVTAEEQLKTFFEMNQKASYVEDLKKEHAQIESLLIKNQEALDQQRMDISFLYSKYQVQTEEDLIRIFSEIKNLPKTEDEIKNLKREREYINNLLTEVEQTNKIIVSPLFDMLNSDHLEEKKEFLKQQLKEKELLLENVKGKLDISTAIFTELEKIESDIEIIEEEQNDLRHKLEISNQTIDFLNESARELENKFIPKIIDDASPLLEIMTNGKYKKLLLNNNFDISLKDEKTGECFSISQLSIGTQEQIYFLLRLAVSETCTENNYPLFLDESFVEYDEQRLFNIFSILKKISKKKQVVFFTSKQRDIEEISKLESNINVINI